MSILQDKGYLSKLKSSEEDYRAETLRIQRKFLCSICSHHRPWAQHTNNEEIAGFHTKAADLIQETMDQYDQILERYSLDTSEL